MVFLQRQGQKWPCLVHLFLPEILFLYFCSTIPPFKWKSTVPNKKYCILSQKIQYLPYLPVEIFIVTIKTCWGDVLGESR
jgi:hypothetical protein